MLIREVKVGTLTFGFEMFTQECAYILGESSLTPRQEQAAWFSAWGQLFRGSTGGRRALKERPPTERRMFYEPEYEAEEGLLMGETGYGWGAAE